MYHPNTRRNFLRKSFQKTSLKMCGMLALVCGNYKSFRIALIRFVRCDGKVGLYLLDTDKRWLGGTRNFRKSGFCHPECLRYCKINGFTGDRRDSRIKTLLCLSRGSLITVAGKDFFLPL